MIAESRRNGPALRPARGRAVRYSATGALCAALGFVPEARACENVLLAAGYDYFFDGSMVLALIVGPFLYGILELYYRRVLRPSFRIAASTPPLRIAALALLAVVGSPWCALGYSCALAYALRFENGFTHGFEGAGVFLGVWSGIAAANILCWRVLAALSRRVGAHAPFDRVGEKRARQTAPSRPLLVFWLACIVALLVFGSPIHTTARHTELGSSVIYALLALLSGGPFVFYQLFIRGDYARFAPGSAERIILATCTVLGGLICTALVFMVLVAVSTLAGGPQRSSAVYAVFGMSAAASYLFIWVIGVLRRNTPGRAA